MIRAAIKFRGKIITGPYHEHISRDFLNNFADDQTERMKIRRAISEKKEPIEFGYFDEDIKKFDPYGEDDNNTRIRSFFS